MASKSARTKKQPEPPSASGPSATSSKRGGRRSAPPEAQPSPPEDLSPVKEEILPQGASLEASAQEASAQEASAQEAVLRAQLAESQRQVELVQMSWAQFRLENELAQSQLQQQVLALTSDLEEWKQGVASLEGQLAERDFDCELLQKQSGEFQALLEEARRDLEAEAAQVTGLQDELAATVQRLESKERSKVEAVRNLERVERELHQAELRCQELLRDNEELELLKEDLEETIVSRRVELKNLRLSEAQARARAEAAEEAQAVLAQSLEELRSRCLSESHSEGWSAELETLRRELEEARQKGSEDGSGRERLERRCLLLENDLRALNQELLTWERLQARWDGERQQLSSEVARLKSTPQPVSAIGEEELKQWKVRAEDLREALRKQRGENERLQERVEVLIKAKDLEETQRKEVESRLRTALRIQARQQQGF